MTENGTAVSTESAADTEGPDRDLTSMVHPEDKKLTITVASEQVELMKSAGWKPVPKASDGDDAPEPDAGAGEQPDGDPTADQAPSSTAGQDPAPAEADAQASADQPESATSSRRRR